jgi:copper(I)-binding protein
MKSLLNIRFSFAAAIAAASFFAAVLPMQAAAAEGASSISINDPYVRAVPPVTKTTAAFMQVQNSSETERAIVSAGTPAAGTVELHTHEHDNGVMRMRQVPKIVLPPGETVSLEPGGLHVMLFDLQSPLAPGDEVSLTLTFDDGSSKQITAPVRHVEKMMQKGHHNMHH